MRELYPDHDDEGYPILLDDEEFKEWLEYIYCDLSAELSAGSGLLYNSDLIHRGGGHVDPDAPERSVLFITFAESRKGKDDDRVFPVGTVHCLSYDSWGHDIQLMTLSQLTQNRGDYGTALASFCQVDTAAAMTKEL